MSFPCDALVADADTFAFRAVSVDAPASVVFRWLCQLRVAPYSYDWLDNFGRTSPSTLTPGLERIERGQRFMTIFQLVDFEPDRHITLTLASRSSLALFGPIAVSYVVRDDGEGRTRLVVKLRVKSGRGIVGRARGGALAWCDLLMMRKQLLTLAKLSATTFTASERAAPSPS